MVGARHVVPESGGFDTREILALSQRFGSVSLFLASDEAKYITATELVIDATSPGASLPGFVPIQPAKPSSSVTRRRGSAHARF